VTTKVAVVYEDHTNDRYIIEPIVIAALRSLGISQPRVSPVTNPRMMGFSTLLSHLCEVVARYERTVAAIVVVFDLDGEDGEDGRGDQVARVRTRLASCMGDCSPVVLLGCHMEAEVYAVWGSRSKVKHAWTQVRSERDPKELYFDPLLTKQDALTVDGGRSRLTKASLKAGWPSLRDACPELATFEADLAIVLAAK
jgi:hypothetical protein